MDLGVNGAHAGVEPFRWFLSEDGTNDVAHELPEYALWYHIGGDTEASYILITCHETPTPMQKADGTTLSLEPDPEKTKQFGI